MLASRTPAQSEGIYSDLISKWERIARMFEPLLATERYPWRISTWIKLGGLLLCLKFFANLRKDYLWFCDASIAVRILKFETSLLDWWSESENKLELVLTMPEHVDKFKFLILDLILEDLSRVPFSNRYSCRKNPSLNSLEDQDKITAEAQDVITVVEEEEECLSLGSQEALPKKRLHLNPYTILPLSHRHFLPQPSGYHNRHLFPDHPPNQAGLLALPSSTYYNYRSLFLDHPPNQIILLSPFDYHNRHLFPDHPPNQIILQDQADFHNRHLFPDHPPNRPSIPGLLSHLISSDGSNWLSVIDFLPKQDSPRPHPEPSEDRNPQPPPVDTSKQADPKTVFVRTILTTIASFIRNFKSKFPPFVRSRFNFPYLPLIFEMPRLVREKFLVFLLDGFARELERPKWDPNGNQTIPQLPDEPMN